MGRQPKRRPCEGQAPTALYGRRGARCRVLPGALAGRACCFGDGLPRRVPLPTLARMMPAWNALGPAAQRFFKARSPHAQRRTNTARPAPPERPHRGGGRGHRNVQAAAGVRRAWRLGAWQDELSASGAVVLDGRQSAGARHGKRAAEVQARRSAAVRLVRCVALPRGSGTCRGAAAGDAGAALAGRLHGVGRQAPRQGRPSRCPAFVG